MNPTKAQREAAARAMFELEYKLMGSDWVIPKWDESHRSYWSPLASAALTAAAEVGGIDWNDIDAARAVATEATIERCAQVADGYIQITPCEKTFTAKAIAAAIRALKDKL